MILGRLTLDDGLIAELYEDLSWHTTKDTELGGLLQALWPGEDYSPADGEPGSLMLSKANKALGGKVEYHIAPTPLHKNDRP